MDKKEDDMSHIWRFLEVGCAFHAQQKPTPDVTSRFDLGQSQSSPTHGVFIRLKNVLDANIKRRALKLFIPSNLSIGHLKKSGGVARTLIAKGELLK